MNWYKESQVDSIGRPIPEWGGKIVYHGTDKEGLEDIQSNGFRFWDMDEQMGYYGHAVHFTESLGYAKSFGSIILVAQLDSDINILNLNDEEGFKVYQQATRNARGDQLRDIVVSLGFDGLYDPGAGDLALYKPEKAKFKEILK